MNPKTAYVIEDAAARLKRLARGVLKVEGNPTAARQRFFGHFNSTLEGDQLRGQVQSKVWGAITSEAFDAALAESELERARSSRSVERRPASPAAAAEVERAVAAERMPVDPWAR